MPFFFMTVFLVSATALCKLQFFLRTLRFYMAFERQQPLFLICIVLPMSGVYFFGACLVLRVIRRLFLRFVRSPFSHLIFAVGRMFSDMQDSGGGFYGFTQTPPWFSKGEQEFFRMYHNVPSIMVQAGLIIPPGGRIVAARVIFIGHHHTYSRVYG